MIKDIQKSGIALEHSLTFVRDNYFEQNLMNLSPLAQ